jgi:hypothetical protein
MVLGFMYIIAYNTANVNIFPPGLALGEGVAFYII